MFLTIYIYILLKLPFPLITFLCVLMFDKISFPIYITLTFLASKFFPIILHVLDSENEITFSIFHVNLSKDQKISSFSHSLQVTFLPAIYVDISITMTFCVAHTNITYRSSPKPFKFSDFYFESNFMIPLLVSGNISLLIYFIIAFLAVIA